MEGLRTVIADPPSTMKLKDLYATLSIVMPMPLRDYKESPHIIGLRHTPSGVRYGNHCYQTTWKNISVAGSHRMMLFLRPFVFSGKECM